MRELVGPVERLAAEGTRATLVRAVDVVGFGAGQYDNALVATAAGPQGGAILRGISDAAIQAAVNDVLADPSGRARLVPVSISDPDAAAGGLSCGGSAQLVVEPLDTVPAELWRRLADGEAVAVATILDGDRPPVTLVVGPAGAAPRTEAAPGPTTTDDDHSAADSSGVTASDGDSVRRVLAAAQALLEDPRALRTSVDLDRGRALVDKVVPRSRVVAVGGGEVVDALIDVGRSLGWLVEPLADGTGAVDAARKLGPADALVVTSHHPRWGADTLAAGLSSRAFFVGALGSRRTQSRRTEALRERGLDDEAVARIHGPVGLDLGGLTPAETALAICAEILAVRSGRDLPSLRSRSGPINA